MKEKWDDSSEERRGEWKALESEREGVDKGKEKREIAIETENGRSE